MCSQILHGKLSKAFESDKHRFCSFPLTEGSHTSETASGLKITLENQYFTIGTQKLLYNAKNCTFHPAFTLLEQCSYKIIV